MGETCQGSESEQTTQLRKMQANSIGQDPQQGCLSSFLKTESALNAGKSLSQQDPNTECAGAVRTMRRRASDLFRGLFHGLTGHLPRLLPATDSEVLELKQTLIKHYGLEDRPDVWLTIFGQLAGRPITSNRISYKRLQTAGLRLTSNAIIKKHKDLEIEKLHARLKEITEEMGREATLSSQASDIQGDVQALPSLKEGMVSDAIKDGIY